MLVAYHGDPAIKEKYVKRMLAHQEMDRIAQGVGYWENGKGCAVGCTLYSGRSSTHKFKSGLHSQYEVQLGISMSVARIEDRMFEGMSYELSKVFPLQFLEAIQPGADLSIVPNQLLVWLLVDPVKGVVHCADSEQCKAVIRDAARLHERIIAGDQPSLSEIREVRKRASSYYATAAYAAYATAADAAAYATSYYATAAYAYATAATAADAATDAARRRASLAASVNSSANASESTSGDCDSSSVVIGVGGGGVGGGGVVGGSTLDEQAKKLLELLAAAPMAKKEEAVR